MTIVIHIEKGAENCHSYAWSVTPDTFLNLPWLTSSLLDNAAEAQRIQVSARLAAVHSRQPKFKST